MEGFPARLEALKFTECSIDFLSHKNTNVLLFYAAESQPRIECLIISIRLCIVSFCLQGTNAEVVLLRSNTNKQ